MIIICDYYYICYCDYCDQKSKSRPNKFTFKTNSFNLASRFIYKKKIPEKRGQRKLPPSYLQVLSVKYDRYFKTICECAFFIFFFKIFLLSSPSIQFPRAAQGKWLLNEVVVAEESKQKNILNRKHQAWVGGPDTETSLLVCLCIWAVRSGMMFPTQGLIAKNIQGLLLTL